VWSENSFIRTGGKKEKAGSRQSQEKAGRSGWLLSANF